MESGELAAASILKRRTRPGGTHRKKKKKRGQAPTRSKWGRASAHAFLFHTQGVDYGGELNAAVDVEAADER